MLIRRLQVANFGSFDSLEVEFPHRGVMQIAGPNNSGKTQLAGALLAGVAGKQVVGVGEGAGPSRIALTVEANGWSETLTREFSMGAAGEVHEVCRFTGAEWGLVDALADGLVRVEPPRLLMGEGERSRIGQKSKLTAEEIGRAIPRELRHHAIWRQLQRNDALNEGSYSAGEAVILQLIHEFVGRAHGQPTPLVIDGVLEMLDSQATHFSRRLLDLIGELSQVILVTARGLDGVPMVADLQNRAGRVRTQAFFARLPGAQKERRQPKPIRPSIGIGDVLEAPESRICEYKEVTSSRPVSAIAEEIDENVVAFLNAGRTQVGSIYWGVRDADRQIVGVALSDSDADRLRRVIIEKVNGIVPAPPPTAFTLILHPLRPSTSAAQQSYLIELQVTAASSVYLYSTASGRVFMKTDAGRLRLSVPQIQDEMLRRYRSRHESSAGGIG